MNVDERNAAIDDFNENVATTFFFLISYNYAIELNLQRNCRHVHFFENALNAATKKQRIERFRRIDNFYELINVYDYSTSETFDDNQIARNLKKTMFEIAALLFQDFMIDNSDDDIMNIEKFV